MAFERVVSGLQETYISPSSRWKVGDELLHLENHYTNDSASSTSCAELEDGRVVRASIAARLIQGQSTRVLKIELNKLTDGKWQLYELAAPPTV